MPSAYLLSQASFSSLTLTSPRLPASAASSAGPFLARSFREEMPREGVLSVQKADSSPRSQRGLTLHCRLVAQGCLTLLPKFHSHRVTLGAPEATRTGGATQAPGAEVGQVPLCGSGCDQDTQARAASWLTAASAGGLPLSTGQPVAATDRLKPESSAATSTTAAQKKLHADALQSSLLQKGRKQNQEQGDKASDPAEGTRHTTQLKRAPGTGLELQSRAPRSNRALWCSTHGTLGFSKPHPPRSAEREPAMLPLAPNISYQGAPKQYWDMRLFCLQAGDRAGHLERPRMPCRWGDTQRNRLAESRKQQSSVVVFSMVVLYSTHTNTAES